ncbi:hypothetical protein BE08_27590 [Sorangium cellulosum]|uniref:Uncharacterized protein n=1 Tax=Sorangium cellulosum TaxID=56 RepID=A0A150NZY2_SORCE|nr:hypothetical protein BE08_27590 [Sorangium cellulosum]
MALPEGWRFELRKKADPEKLLFWIKDAGGNAVVGAYSFYRFDFSIDPSRATEVTARSMQDRHGPVEARRTEIDGKEAHIVLSGMGDDRRRWIMANIYEGSSAFSSVKLSVDGDYLRRNPRVPYAIFNSIKTVPGQLSERRVKGSFSFKCDDGSARWLSDSSAAWGQKGFRVTVGEGDDGFMAGISQVSTLRFEDIFNMKYFRRGEQATEIQIAGKVYPARALLPAMRVGELAIMAFMFKHDGKDYMLTLGQTLREGGEADIENLHKNDDVLRVLNTNFYFDG